MSHVQRAPLPFSCLPYTLSLPSLLIAISSSSATREVQHALRVPRPGYPTQGPGDPTAPASVSPSTPPPSATPLVAPASVSAMDCSVASQLRHDDDVDMRSSEKCKAEVDAVRPPSASTRQLPTIAAPALVSTSALSSSSSPLPGPQMGATIPVFCMNMG